MKKLREKCFTLILVASLCILMNGNALSQTALATLEGIISDDQGIPLPGALLRATNAKTGYVYSTRSGNDGYYVLHGVQPGNYDVEASLDKFTREKKTGLILNVSARLSINFSLKPSAIEEEIIVTAKTPLIELTKSEISMVIDRQKIDDLPLSDKDFASLTVLKAGVLEGRSNALPTGSEEIQIDGMSNEAIIDNTNRILIPADAIQEFRVMTNQFETEYGHTAGMIQTGITRSGTNQTRGRVAYFYRDEFLDNPNYFINHASYGGEELPKDQWTKSDYKHNNFALSLGGPIKKDKFHYFAVYDGTFKETYRTITSPLVPRESIVRPDNTHLGMLKLNYQMNERNMFSFRFQMRNWRRDNLGVGGNSTKEQAFSLSLWDVEFQLSWTLFPTSNSINELSVFFVSDRWKNWPHKEYVDTYSITRPGGEFGKWNSLPQHNFGDRYELIENFTLILGKHRIKAGIDFQYNPSGSLHSSDLYPGYYIFVTDAPFNPANPATYPVLFLYRESPTSFTLKTYQFSIFIQDSWRVAPNVTLNYGFRYNLYDYTGLNLEDVNPANFNPRIAFSWDPFGDGKTSIRGGIGTYSSNPIANLGYTALTSTMEGMEIYLIMFPGYPDPSVPNPFIPASQSTLPQLQETVISAIPLNFSLQTSLGIQREVLSDLAVGVDFVYTRGYNLTVYENLNPIIPGTDYVRLDPTKGDIWTLSNDGKSDYKGIYLTISKRFSHGWSLDIGYTLGKAMTNTEGTDRPWSYEDDAWERAYGRKSTDARHKLTVSGLVELPFGFKLSAIFYYRSAYPFNAVVTGDSNRDGLFGDYIDLYRNSRVGFDEFWINARLSWSLKIARYRLQILCDAFNITNKANFENIVPYVDQSRFGQPISAGDPRLVQLGVRLDF